MPESSAHSPVDAPRAGQRGGGDARDLSSEMQTLGSVIKELEGQLDRVVALNEALKQDLDDERGRRVALESRVDELREQLRSAQQEVTGKENLAAEVSQLSHERARMTASLRELSQKVQDAQQAARSQEQLIDRLRTTRTDALEEVESVESQFERAMHMVGQTKAQLAVVTEERDALGSRLRSTEEKLRQAMEERDVLTAEVDESRALLDEIRRSLADACVVSTAGISEAGDERSLRRG
jgi:chromosome segregation ATPase